VQGRCQTWVTIFQEPERLLWASLCPKWAAFKGIWIRWCERGEETSSGKIPVAELAERFRKHYKAIVSRTPWVTCLLCLAPRCDGCAARGPSATRASRRFLAFRVRRSSSSSALFRCTSPRSRRLSSVPGRSGGRRGNQRASATAVKGACDSRRRRAALQRERAAVLAAGGEGADATGGPAALTAAAWRQHSSP